MTVTKEYVGIKNNNDLSEKPIFKIVLANRQENKYSVTAETAYPIANAKMPIKRRSEKTIVKLTMAAIILEIIKKIGFFSDKNEFAKKPLQVIKNTEE